MHPDLPLFGKARAGGAIRWRERRIAMPKLKVYGA